MKITGEHYETLKARVLPILPRLADCETHHAANPKIMDASRAALWDVYHASRIYEVYSYQQWDYKDSHIETAMRRIIAEWRA